MSAVTDSAVPDSAVPDSVSIEAMWQQQLCRLMQRNGWGLVSCADLWAIIVAEQQEPLATAADLAYAAQGAYGPILYAACLHTSALPTRRRAFQEIHQYLYRKAYWAKGKGLIHVMDLEDVAQAAIVKIAQRLADCQNQRAFIDFCAQQLRTIITTEERRNARQPQFYDADIGTLAEMPKDAVDAFGPVELALPDCLEPALASLTNPNMRAVIWHTFVDGWSSAEIAATLDLTAGNVNVLRKRGLAQLRTNQDFVACLNDLHT